MASLKDHWHGKAQVRLLKTDKTSDTHKVLELTVGITLWGDYDRVYTAGDNTGLVATDTMKNTVYVIAKKTKFDSLESYGLKLSAHFLEKYPMLNAVKVDLQEHPWARVEVGGQPHQHGFVRARSDYHTANVHRTRQGNVVQVESGIRNMVVLKTTQSGFVGFLKDQNTSLPDIPDRLLSTSVSADWRYTTTPGEDTDFNSIFEVVRASLLDTFFGPANTGVYSKSVQETMFKMGSDVLKAVSSVADVTLDMPNIHFLPVRSLSNHGLEWTGEVHLPTSEPHGTICATVQRSRL